MNDEMREKLSAYLDGALVEPELGEIERALAESAELRADLEALRSVSQAVKGLPKAGLPPGFMARLEEKRAPARSWIFLPPAYRPAVMALSCGAVALMVWDKVRPPYEPPPVGWLGDRAKITTAAQAPKPQYDLVSEVAQQASKLSSVDGAAAPAASEAAAELKDKEAVDQLALMRGKAAAAKARGRPLDDAAPDLRGFGGGAALGGAAGARADLAMPAKTAPAPAAAPEPSPEAFLARTEQERSAMNERLYQGLEKQKKDMGIARVLERDEKAESADQPAPGADVMALHPDADAQMAEGRRLRQASTVRRASSVASVRGGALNASPARALSSSNGVEERPRDAAALPRVFVLRSAEAARGAWDRAGLAGDPPTAGFPDEEILFLSGPSGCGIVSVKPGKTRIIVYYRESGFDSPSARARVVPSSKAKVLLRPAP